MNSESHNSSIALVNEIICLTLFAWLLAGSMSVFNQNQRIVNDDGRYYPLAKGNYWTYGIDAPNLQGSKKVTWQVDRVVEGRGDLKIYVVIPRPAETDDQVMNLVIRSDGVFDQAGDFYLMKFPMKMSEEWSYPAIESYYRVLNVHAPCSSGRFSFDDCLVVENRDVRAQIRTITTYAKGVGPIKYTYTKYSGLDPKSADTPISTVTLAAYKLSDMSAHAIR